MKDLNSHVSGLNRTSVGLKHMNGGIKADGSYEPQSNQRGIETQECKNIGYGVELPQSNQRGIETRPS